MNYKINLQKTEEGYSVWCPGLPGCCSQGLTKTEALDNIKDAIADHLVVAVELGKNYEFHYVEAGFSHA